MIPKIIHWCWFGDRNPSDVANRCYASWKSFLPDYQIKLWNESNFDIHLCKYVEDAYRLKKYAFVADVARLYALYTDGGIYLDSDVEVIQNMDIFLNDTAFLGYEIDNCCGTGTIGSIKNSQFIKELLDEYYNRQFIMQNNSLNLTTNCIYTNRHLQSKGIDINKKELNEEGYVKIYPVEYFCPRESTGHPISKDSYTIHHFCGSWC